MHDHRITDTYQDDEISLADVWRTLVGHKKLIFLVWGLVILTGLAAAVLMPEKYAYTTLIEIGGQWDDPVETADAARARLLAGIIPVVQNRYLAEGKKITDVKVSIPEKSPVFVFLESQGTAEAASIHLAFHAEIVDVLAQEHHAAQNKVREVLVIGQETVRRRITALDNENIFLTEKLKHLDDEETYLEEKIKQVRAAVAAASKWSDKAGAAAAKEGAAAAFTHMMATNQIEQQRFLTTLENRVLVGLPGERAEINKTITDNAQSVEEQRSALNITTSELGRLRETKALIPPARSASSVAPDRRVISMLAIFIGLMLGVLSAFMVEFLLKVRKEAGTRPA